MTKKSDLYEALVCDTIRKKFSENGLSTLFVELKGGNKCNEHDVYIFLGTGVLLDTLNAKMPNALHITTTFSYDGEKVAITEKDEARFTLDRAPVLYKMLAHIQSHISDIKAAEEASTNINYTVPPMTGMDADQWNLELAKLASEQFVLFGEGYVASGPDEKTCMPVPTSSPEELARNFDYSLALRRKQNGSQKIPVKCARDVMAFLQGRLPGTTISLSTDDEDVIISIGNWDKTQNMPAVEDLGVKDGIQYWGVKADVNELPDLAGKSDENDEITFLIKETNGNKGLVSIRGKQNMDTVQMQLAGKAREDMREREGQYWSNFIEDHRVFC